MKLPQSIEIILQNEIDPAFAERARLIIEKIIEAKPKRVLDAGCGRGFYVKLASLLDFPVEIVGIDLQKKYLAVAYENCKRDKRVKLKNASIYEIPYEKEYFDFIISSEVLEHLDDDIKAVTELRRVLKKNGTLVVTVPNKDFPFLWDPLNWLLMRFLNTHVNKNIWWLAGIWADHERLYSKVEIKTLLANKFNINEIKPVLHWCWPFSHFLLYGIGKNIVERISNKSFDRFNFTENKPISGALARLMALPAKLDIFHENSLTSANWVVIANKPIYD